MADLQDATVRVRGVAGEVFNSRKQLVSLQLAVSKHEEASRSSSPAARTRLLIPATAIGNLLSYGPHTQI